MDDEKSGAYTLYDQTGKKLITGSFQKNKLNGLWIEYYSSAGENMKWKGTYVNGQKAGKWLCYDEKGNVTKKTKYELDPKQAAW